MNTGQPLEQIALDTDRDRYMTAAEAMEYGLVRYGYESREDQQLKLGDIS